MTEAESLWTVEDLAHYLQVPAETVRYWRYIGKGPHEGR